MKTRDRIVCLLLLLAALAVGLFLHSRPRQLPEEECGPVYQLYSHSQGIKASFIQNFEINDTISVNVTTLQATTDSAWEMLKRNFNIKKTSQSTQQKIDAGEDVISMVFSSKTDPGQPDTTNRANNNILTISRLNKMISIFITTDENQIDAIRNYNWNYSIKQQQQ